MRRMRDAIERDYDVSDFRNHLNEQMKNPAFAAEYKALELQYAFAKQMIAARIGKGLT